MNKCYKFETDCVNSSERLLRPMLDNAREINRKTFLKYVDKASLREIERQLGYVHHPSQGMTMAGDGCVSYHKSKYRGRPCVFFVWSCIEYIFCLPSKNRAR
jgi:hypothetical protein